MHKLPILLAVFDLDGTLTESSNTIYNSAVDALNHFNIKVDLPKEELTNKIGAHFQDIFADMNIIVPDIEHYIEVFKSIYFNHIDDTYLYDGVVDGLKKLKNHNLKTAILTTKAQEQTDRIISHFQIGDYFDFVMGRRKGIEVKPSSMPLLKICDELNIPPVQTIMIGDTELDIKCAKGAGCRVIAVDYGYRNNGTLSKENPDYIVSTFSEAVEIIISLS